MATLIFAKPGSAVTASTTGFGIGGWRARRRIVVGVDSEMIACSGRPRPSEPATKPASERVATWYLAVVQPRAEVFDQPVAVIGDVHGCADLLAQLLHQLGDLTVIVVVDVGDRGPDTRGVIDQLVARNAIGVVGNHDVWLRAWARREGFDTFALRPIMGGRATLDSYGVVGTTPREIEAEAWRVPAAHREWLDRLVVAVDLEVCGTKYWVVHAPFKLRPDEELVPEDVVPWSTSPGG